MRILFCCNTLQGFCNFRLDVVGHLIGRGIEAVIVYPPKDGDKQILLTLPIGCRAIPCIMSPNGKSLIQDLRYLWRLLRIIRREKPNLVFNYTVKPNIYGGFAARLLGLPSVAVVPGLGYSFARGGLQGTFLRKFYMIGLGFAKAVFVLNSSDRDCLVDAGLNVKKIVLLTGGEGVNLERFEFSKGDYTRPRFLMISRLLYSKGYLEFVAVAKLIKEVYPDTRFEIAGTLNETNPAGIPRSVVEEDEQKRFIRYLGYIEDIKKELADPNTVIVLPSYYREGMNRSLMEACACGRPIITTNLPGLKELVVDGENGFLVEPKNVDNLYEKIAAFMKLPVEDRVQMGRRSRAIAEQLFDVSIVKNEYDLIIRKLLGYNV